MSYLDTRMKDIYLGVDQSTPNIQHFGILGMKWGIRRYQNEDGTLTEEGKKRYGSDMERLKELNTIYSKEYIQKDIEKAKKETPREFIKNGGRSLGKHEFDYDDLELLEDKDFNYEKKDYNWTKDLEKRVKDFQKQYIKNREKDLKFAKPIKNKNFHDDSIFDDKELFRKRQREYNIKLLKDIGIASAGVAMKFLQEKYEGIPLNTISNLAIARGVGGIIVNRSMHNRNNDEMMVRKIYRNYKEGQYDK